MPLFWLSTAFLAGLVLGAAWPLGWNAWAGIGAGLVALALVERRFLARFSWYSAWRVLSHLPIALVIAAVALGGLRTVTAQPVWGQADLAWYNQRGTYRLSGVIQQPPVPSLQSVTLVVAVDQLSLMSEGQPPEMPRPVQGLAQVILATGENWHYGDRLELEGAPLIPQAAGVDYFQDYLARRDIYTQIKYPAAHLIARDAGSWFWAMVYDLQDLANRTIRSLLPQPESALLAGILLGYTRDLPESVAQAFRDTGIAHIIAVSGFNITIVSGLFIALLGRLLRARYAVPLAILAVAGYCLLTGGTASVVRAAIMGGIGMIGPLLGRRQVGINSLAFTAGVMCLLSPGLPWDVSFQLSFGATLGLVVYADFLQGGFTRLAGRWLPAPIVHRLAGPVGEFFLVTLAAQLFTLPVTAVHFQRVSLSALLANPLVLPVQSLAMILGGLALVLGMVFLPLGQLVAWLCWPLLAYTIRTAEVLAQIQNSVLNLDQFSPLVIALYYAGLLALALPWVRRRLRPVWKPSVGLALVGLLAVGLWRAALIAPDGRLHLDIFNQPDGPALLLRAPSGQAWLVNGSSQVDALADALGRRLPAFSGRLDGLLVTSRSAAVFSGLQTLTRSYAPGLVSITERVNDSTTLKRLLNQLNQQGARIIPIGDGDLAFDLGQGAVLRVLADLPSGTALGWEWRGFRGLLPGGVPPGDLLLQPLNEISLLVLSPADLENMSAEVWTARFQPRAVLFTGGGAPVLPGWVELDRYAWVSFQTDGTRLWIEGQNR